MEYNEEKVMVVQFKQGLFGLNKAQVNEYISVLEENAKRAAQVFDEKIEEMKNTVALISREKEIYVQKIEILNNELKSQKDICIELEKTAEECVILKNKYNAVVEDNYALKKQIEAYKEKIEFTEKLEEEIYELRAKCENLEVICKAKESEIQELNKKHQHQLDEVYQENKKIQEYITQKRIEGLKGMKNHKYQILRLEDLMINFKTAFNELKDSFEIIEPF